MRAKLNIIFLLLILASVKSFGIETSQMHITYWGDRAYSPYEYMDEEGNPAGFNIELIQRIAEINHWELSIKMAPWHVVMDTMKKSTLPNVTSLLYSPERAKTFYYSLPHSKVNYSVFVRKNSSIEKFSDVQNNIILVQQSDIMHESVMKIGNNNKIVTYNSFEAALSALNDGYGDLVLCSMIQGNFYIEKENLKNIHAVDNPFAPYDYCFGVNQKNDELLADMNEALMLLKKTGELAKLHEQWYGDFEETPYARFMHRYGKMVLIAAVLFIIVGIIFIRILRQSVKRKTEDLQKELLEREEIEKKLRIAKEKAEKSDKLKTAFLENLSHEIRTPMNGIMGFTDIILEGESSQEEEKTYLQTIKNSSNQLLRIINDIITISKLNIGDIEVHIKPFVLYDCLKKVCNDNQALRKKYNVSFEFITNNLDKQTKLSTDAYILKNIITQLLDNAFKFSSNGNVKLIASLPENQIQIEVVDDGIGIALEDQMKIFDAFYRANHGLTYVEGGTGLGLAIVMAMCNLLNGSIEVKSEIGKGSHFTIRIPIEQ